MSLSLGCGALVVTSNNVLARAQTSLGAGRTLLVTHSCKFKVPKGG